MKSKKNLRKFRASRWWSNVQALRCDCELSERALSQYIGKSDNYISNAIKNGGAPNLADALIIAEAFEISIEELAFGAVGLEIRKAQLEAELAKIREEIEDIKNDGTKGAGTDEQRGVLK